MPEIVIEPVRPDSVRGADALRRYVADVLERVRGRPAAPGEVDAHLAADPTEGLTPTAGLFVVAHAGGRGVLGCGGLRLTGPDLPPEAAEIKRMFVDPAVRGRGLGTRLLGHLTDRARESGRTRLVLDTRSELSEAVRLYTRHGFGEVAAYNTNPYAQRWYAKDLR